jgi:hypothetical protein
VQKPIPVTLNLIVTSLHDIAEVFRYDYSAIPIEPSLLG